MVIDWEQSVIDNMTWIGNRDNGSAGNLLRCFQLNR